MRSRAIPILVRGISEGKINPNESGYMIQTLKQGLRAKNWRPTTSASFYPLENLFARHTTNSAIRNPPAKPSIITT